MIFKKTDKSKQLMSIRNSIFMTLLAAALLTA